jgi:hypothetical protein
MKFLYADSLDYVDPRYDFEKDESPIDREPYWDDQYPHEIMGQAPYDGLLVSRAIVDGVNGTTRYPRPLAMRFRLVGARTFLRFNQSKYRDCPIFGDCGAFSYANEHVPPYTPEDMIDFYEDGCFTHGISIDHIIFDFIPDAKSFWQGINSDSPESDDRYRRFRLTLDLAESFMLLCQKHKVGFQPVGVIQGWSQISMALAARKLAELGYRYLALGGMVPLSVPDIHAALRSVHSELNGYSDIKLHILGFAKADNLHEFVAPRLYPKLASIDTTSPLLRAFKDDRKNYYLPNQIGGFEYFTAIRVPQAFENIRIKKAIAKGIYKIEDILQLEDSAMKSLRAYDRNMVSLDSVIDKIMQYSRVFIIDGYHAKASDEKKLSDLADRYRVTLLEKPWKRCNCPVCSELSIEIIIFRGSNRNKRRGIHNLYVFHNHLKKIENQNDNLSNL